MTEKPVTAWGEGGKEEERKKEKEYDYLFTYGMCPSYTVFLQQ